MLRGFFLLLLLGVSSSTFDISVPAGSSFTVPCLRDSEVDLFFPTYTWTFTPEQSEGNIDKSDHDLNCTESELKFNPVEPRHTGQYTCVAKGQSSDGLMKVKRRFKLHVHEIPIYKWWVVIVTEGDTAVLPCNPVLETGADTSHATARWTKGEKGYPDLKLETKRQITDEEKGRETASSRFSWVSGPEELDFSIEMANITLEDADLYNCDVTAGLKMHKVMVELIVEPLPPPRCLNQIEPWEPCPDPDSRSWNAIMSESVTALSVQLYNKSRNLQRRQNLLISPISVAGLLSHLLLGARGETRTDLEKALDLPPGFSCLHSAVKKMREETKESLKIANQIFYNPKHMLGEAFVKQSLEFYDTVPGKLTNSSEENVKMINNWVSERTQGKIEKLVESVESTTEFILLNAVYFKGKWKTVFEATGKKGLFSTLSGQLVSVPILYSSKFNLAMTYIRNLKAQVAKFPLTGKNNLYIMVPSSVKESALTTLENALDENNIRAMVKELDMVTPVIAEVTLPKFKLSVNTDLDDLLKKIGLTALFSSPNLCALFPSEEVVELADSQHKAFLSLTEQGVEAAAASSISFSRSFNTFSAMQPFVFIMWSEQTMNPLFMGSVIHPNPKP